MSQSWRVVVAFALAVLLLVPWSSQAGGQDDKKEKVRITTVDGVELNAHFYRCTDAKIKDPPAILMLPAVGEKSTSKNWVALAHALQTKAAVLTFDYRGHGGSTEVDPSLFWKIAFNVKNIKGGNTALQASKQEINFKEFLPFYNQALVNDIAACKAFLDRKNDLRGTCNSSSLILIGAESGATLGAIFLNSEWHRHRVTVNPVNLVTTAEFKAEGRHVAACVWLSIAPNLNARDQTGARTVNVVGTLDIAMRQNATPMVFLYSDDDDRGKALAKSATNFIKAKDKAKYPYTGSVEFNGGKLRGSDMLVKSLAVDRAIMTYLFGDGKDNEGVIAAKGHEWGEHEFKKSQFIWRQPNTPPGVTAGSIQAHYINDPNFVFNDYGRYIK